MTDPSIPAPIRKRRGCFFYGCMTFLVLSLLLCLLAILTIGWIKNRINDFTDAAPVPLPKVEMADSELRALEQRVTIFGNALQQGKPAEPLTLTEREVNALISRKPEMKQLADRVYVSLNANQVKGQVSIPLNGLGWFTRGRYLNGEAAFKVSLKNGVLIVIADEIKVKGNALPEMFMKEVRKENLAKDAYRDPKAAETIGKLDSIQVQDGLAIIKARAKE